MVPGRSPSGSRPEFSVEAEVGSGNASSRTRAVRSSENSASPDRTAPLCASSGASNAMRASGFGSIHDVTIRPRPGNANGDATRDVRCYSSERRDRGRASWRGIRQGSRIHPDREAEDMTPPSVSAVLKRRAAAPPGRSGIAGGAVFICPPSTCDIPLPNHSVPGPA